MVMKFSPWFFWSVYSSCSTIPQHVWMRIWKISLMFWVSLNARSNVFFCLSTRRVLDLKAINQTPFHTLNMSPAFPVEEVRASWFQVRRKQHFFFLASVTTTALSREAQQGDDGILMCFLKEAHLQTSADIYLFITHTLHLIFLWSAILGCG